MSAQWPPPKRKEASPQIVVPVVLSAVCVFVISLSVLAHVLWHGSGSLSEWVAGFSTLGAFVAAAVAAVFASEAFRAERTRDDRLAQDRRSAQASLIAGWFDSRIEEERVPNSLKGSQFERMFQRTQRGVCLRNASDVPVTNLSVTAIWATGETVALPVPVLPPATDPIFKPFPSDPGVKPPEGEPQIQIEFMDSAGVSWCRPPGGRLLELVPLPQT